MLKVFLLGELLASVTVLQIFNWKFPRKFRKKILGIEKRRKDKGLRLQDVEDRDLRLLVHDRRQGLWLTFQDLQQKTH
jgi:hypothetical protein